MDPQAPNTPQPSSPTPTSPVNNEPAPTTVAPANPEPPVTPQPQPASQTAPKGKKRLLIMVAGLIVLIILAVGGFFAYTKFSDPLKLTTYSTEEYSIKYPGGYDKKDETRDGATFVGFIAKDSQTDGVSIGTTSLEAYTQEEIELTMSKIKENYAKIFESSGKTPSINTTETTHQGKKAVLVTVPDQPYEDGHISSVTTLYVLVDKTMYVVQVSAPPDSTLDKNASKIVSSFTVR